MTSTDTAFAAIHARGLPQPGQFSTLIVSDVRGSRAWVALESDGSEHLFLDSGSEELPVVPEALSLRRRNLVLESQQEHLLDLGCATPTLAEVFEQFCAAIVSELPTSDSAITSLRTVLERWRRFLVPGEEPSAARQAALVGELLVLEDLASGSPDAIDWWTGPSGARHDFRHSNRAIEVKTTLAASGYKMTVNGVEQLLPPEGGLLVLHHVRVEAVVGGSHCVADVVESVLSRGVSVEKLFRVLSDAGVPPASLPACRAAFEIRGRTTFAIDESVPRIVPSSFTGLRQPPGTGELSYQIDLGPHLARALDESGWRQFLHDFGSATDSTGVRGVPVGSHEQEEHR